MLPNPLFKSLQLDFKFGVVKSPITLFLLKERKMLGWNTVKCGRRDLYVQMVSILHDFRRLDFPPQSFQKCIVDKRGLPSRKVCRALYSGNVFPDWFSRYYKQS
jgi:hypothetical protein